MRFNSVSLSFVGSSLGRCSLGLCPSNSGIGFISIGLRFDCGFLCCCLFVALRAIGTLSAITFVDAA